MPSGASSRLQVQVSLNVLSQHTIFPARQPHTPLLALQQACCATVSPTAAPVADTSQEVSGSALTPSARRLASVSPTPTMHRATSNRADCSSLMFSTSLAD